MAAWKDKVAETTTVITNFIMFIDLLFATTIKEMVSTVALGGIEKGE